MTTPSQPPIPMQEAIEIQNADQSVEEAEIDTPEQQEADLAEGAGVISAIDSPEGDALIERLKGDG